MPKKKPAQEPGIPEWIVTYGDLMSLLLTFFILLAAFSELKQPREYQKAVDSIKEALGFEGGLGMVVNKGNPRNSSINRLPRSSKLMGDKSARAEINEQNVSGRDQTVSRIHEGSRWTIGGTVLFDPGSSDLSDDGKAVLLSAAEKVRGQTRKVLVRGHAWGVEDKASGLDFTDLSFARAKTALEFLATEGGVRRELLLPVAAGNSEPLSADRYSAEATIQNRRVEIMVTEVTLEEVHPDPEWQGG